MSTLPTADIRTNDRVCFPSGKYLEWGRVQKIEQNPRGERIALVQTILGRRVKRRLDRLTLTRRARS